MTQPKKGTEKDVEKGDGAETPHARLQKGEENLYLEGLLAEGEDVETQIADWIKERGRLREAVRGVVNTGFGSPDQIKRANEMYPVPKRKAKTDAETPAGDGDGAEKKDEGDGAEKKDAA